MMLNFLATSFFYIYVMATSFFYIYIDIYIDIYKLTERAVVILNAIFQFKIWFNMFKLEWSNSTIYSFNKKMYRPPLALPSD